MHKYIKIFVCLILVLCISGCSNDNKSTSSKKKEKWKDIFQTSEFKLEDNYIVGRIKNTKDKAYDITIYFELMSGTLVEEEYYYEVIKPNETKDIECMATGYDDSYEVKLKKIEYKEKEIPKVDYDDISVEALKYYFEDIYDKHISLTSFFGLYIEEDSNNYPYIDLISYMSFSDSETMNIWYDYESDDHKLMIIFQSAYDVKNADINSLKIITLGVDEELDSEIRINLAMSIDENNYSSIYRTLGQEAEEGKCWAINKWCAAKTIDEDGYVTYYIESR